MDSDVIAKMKGTFVERPTKTAKKTGEITGESRKERKRRLAAEKSRNRDAEGHGGMNMDTGEQPPNKILFCTNLPEETTEQMLAMLFNQ